MWPRGGGCSKLGGNAHGDKRWVENGGSRNLQGFYVEVKLGKFYKAFRLKGKKLVKIRMWETSQGWRG